MGKEAWSRGRERGAWSQNKRDEHRTERGQEPEFRSQNGKDSPQRAQSICANFKFLVLNFEFFLNHERQTRNDEPVFIHRPLRSRRRDRKGLRAGYRRWARGEERPFHSFG